MRQRRRSTDTRHPTVEERPSLRLRSSHLQWTLRKAVPSRMTPARRSGSPHLPLTLPPRVACTQALALCMQRGAVEKSEGPRTGSASRRAVAHAATSRMTPARRSGSPHLPLTLPPRFARTHALAPCIATKLSRNPRIREPAPQRAPLLHLLFLFRVGRRPRAAPGRHISGCPSHQRVGRPCTCAVPHPRVEKCENPRTGSATRAACAHAVRSRTKAVRLFTSPHLGLPLPPHVGRPCTCAVPHTGRDMRESENRLRSARHACICCSESDDSCAPVQVAASRVAPPATRWPTGRMHHAMPHQGVENPRVREPAPQRAPRAARAHAVPSRTTAVHLFASPHLRLPRPPRVAPCHQGVEK